MVEDFPRFYHETLSNFFNPTVVRGIQHVKTTITTDEIDLDRREQIANGDIMKGRANTQQLREIMFGDFLENVTPYF